jgi:hypothetical protein
VIGFHVDQNPAPMLLLNPTLEMSETFSKDRLAPMVRDTQMRDILRDRPYYWVSAQSEYSTDILFKTRQDLCELYCTHNYSATAHCALAPRTS